ncbi:MAG: 2-hydroxychromene-2-carboxylate isomerase [Alphaproteobacteria bacterium]|nr:MAG: 2-hydroxychromene-2-carboxylate isomerase [Alphaproteobacteria bacterium]
MKENTPMPQAIDVYFEFSSSYSYICHEKIAELANRHGLDLNWKCISLGAIFKQLNHAMPPLGSPKQKYLWHDVERSARQAGLEYNWPETFPFNSMHAARGFYWISDTAPDQIVPYLKAVFKAAFAEGREVGNPEVLKSIVTSLGLDGDTYLAALSDDSYKSRLKQETIAAQGRDVFGCPTFYFKDEMFWGADRLAALETYIKTEKDT